MKMQKGFTLVELMIVVVIMGILSSIAIPNYIDYVMRGKLAEGTAVLADAKVRFEQSYADSTPPAYTNAAANRCPAATTNFTYLCASATAPDTFLITATGKGNISDFSYSINQANVRATVSIKSSWGVANPACWITTRGGHC